LILAKVIIIKTIG